MKIEGNIESQVVEQTSERVVAEMPVQPGILNPYGSVNAGAILWFADVTATILVLGPSRPTEGMAGFPLCITLYQQPEGRDVQGGRYLRKAGETGQCRTDDHLRQERPVDCRCDHKSCGGKLNLHRAVRLSNEAGQQQKKE
jgi:hypothetical protein